MKKITPWLGSVLIISVIFGTIYITTQQVLRQGANDPQIQLAEDVASALDNGKTPASLVSGAVNVGTSLAPFIVVYNKQGSAVISNGYLQGKVPFMPLGVLQASSGRTYHAVTWQPDPKTRIASITVSAHDYYVTSGRSLAEVEKREAQVLIMVAAGWITSVAIASFLAIYPKLGQREKLKPDTSH
jgi:hypothetical protein